MAEIKTPGTLKENNTIITSTPQPKTDDVVIEHDDSPATPPVETLVAARAKKDDPLAEHRANMEAAERALAEERERRVAAERERDTARAHATTANVTLQKTVNEKVAAQEAAVLQRLETAKGAVENAERAYEEAIDTGKPAKEQVKLQKLLAEAVYAQKGAETAKAHFDNWKEREKNKPAPAPDVRTSQYSEAAQRWIDAHPRFKTDKMYKRLAEGAAIEAENNGIKADSTAYFQAIEGALQEAGMLHDSGTEPVTSALRKTSGTSMAAPVSQDSTEAGARGGSAAQERRTGQRIVKLDENQRARAIAQYGKNSTFKLSDQEAYKRFGERLLEIRDKRANGERI